MYTSFVRETDLRARETIFYTYTRAQCLPASPEHINLKCVALALVVLCGVLSQFSLRYCFQLCLHFHDYTASIDYIIVVYSAGSTGSCQNK